MSFFFCVSCPFPFLIAARFVLRKFDIATMADGRVRAPLPAATYPVARIGIVTVLIKTITRHYTREASRVVSNTPRVGLLRYVSRIVVISRTHASTIYFIKRYKLINSRVYIIRDSGDFLKCRVESYRHEKVDINTCV